MGCKTFAALWCFGAGLFFFIAFFSAMLLSVPFRYGISFKQRMRSCYPKSRWGYSTELLNAAFSVLSCVSVVMETYNKYTTESFVLKAFAIDVFINDFFLCHYFLALYMALSRWRYLISMQAVVDVVTIVPTLVALALSGCGVSDNSFSRINNLLRVSRVLRLLRLFRALQFILASRKPGSSSDAAIAVRQALTRLALSILVSLVCLAGLFNFLVVVQDVDWGTGKGTMVFHDAIYYTVITFTTVGFGDITPPTALGRIVVTWLVVSVFTWATTASAKVVHLLSIRPKHKQRLSKSRGRNHIIVGCDSSCLPVVRGLIKELLLQARWKAVPHIVLLVAAEPDLAWNAFLLEYATNDTLSYHNGDLQSLQDLDKIRLRSAKACFVLSDRTSHDTIAQDRQTLMRALTVHDVNPRLELYCLVTHTETRAQMVHMGLDRKRIVCANRLVTQLVAAACRQPGFSTVVANLICHMPELDPLVRRISRDTPDAGSAKKRYLRGCQKGWDDPLEGAELMEVEKLYLQGLRMMLEQIDLGSYFGGENVRSVAAELYQNCGAVLVAVADGSVDRFKALPIEGTPDTAPAQRARSRAVSLYPGADRMVGPLDKGYIVVELDGAEGKVWSYCSRRQRPGRLRRAASRLLPGVGSGNPADGSSGPGSGSGGNATPANGAGGGGLSAGGSGRFSANSSGRFSANSSGKFGASGGSGRYTAGGGLVRYVADAKVPKAELEPMLGQDTLHATASGIGRPRAMTRRASAVLEEPAAGHIVFITQSLVAVHRLMRALAAHENDSAAASAAGAAAAAGLSAADAAALAAAAGRRRKHSRLVVVCPFHPWNAEVDATLEVEMKRQFPANELEFVRGSLKVTTVALAHPTRAQLVVLAAPQATPLSGVGEGDDPDDEMIQVLADVLSLVGTDVRVVAALNVPSYAEQHAVLSTRMRMLTDAERRLPRFPGHEPHHRRTSISLDFSQTSSMMQPAPEFFRPRDIRIRPKFMSHFALKSGYTSGDLVLAGTAELLLVQSFIVPNVAEVVELLLAPAHHHEDHHHHPADKLAGGGGGDGDGGGNIAGDETVGRGHGTAALVRPSAGYSSRFVNRVLIPLAFWSDVARGRCKAIYGDLVSWLLLEEDVMTLGLFRRWGAEMHDSILNNGGEDGLYETGAYDLRSATGYGTGETNAFRDTIVVTNPSPTAALSLEDAVYVIMALPPPEAAPEDGSAGGGGVGGVGGSGAVVRGSNSSVKSVTGTKPQRSSAAGPSPPRSPLPARPARKEPEPQPDMNTDRNGAPLLSLGRRELLQADSRSPSPSPPNWSPRSLAKAELMRKDSSVSPPRNGANGSSVAGAASEAAEADAPVRPVAAAQTSEEWAMRLLVEQSPAMPRALDTARVSAANRTPFSVNSSVSGIGGDGGDSAANSVADSAANSTAPLIACIPCASCGAQQDPVLGRRHIGHGSQLVALSCGHVLCRPCLGAANVGETGEQQARCPVCGATATRVLRLVGVATAPGSQTSARWLSQISNASL